MKRIILAVIVVLLVSGISTQAFADPYGLSDRRGHDPVRYERHQQSFDHRSSWDNYYRDHRWISRRPVIVHRVPPPPVPVIVERVPVAPMPALSSCDLCGPGFALFLPNFSIVIR